MLILGGTLFSLESLKSDKPEIKLKGKLLLPAFYIFAISVILDSLPLEPIIVLLIRILQNLAGILFYLGFILPDWAKNLFLKDK